MLRIISTLFLASQVFFISPSLAQKAEKAESMWKIGVARTVITPRENMWMSGYAARDKPSQGAMHDLWAKAIAFEDARGNKALMITADIIGYSREMSLSLCNQIEAKFGIQRANITLSSSHTHSGPVINSNLFGIYPSFDEEQKKQIAENLQFVERQMLDVAGRALSNLTPANLTSGVGIARFAVNRRENAWTKESIYDASVKGPSDHVVQVFTVTNVIGQPTAVLFGYSCHATCLSGHQWSGDYPGFAQMALEQNNPGLTALFFTGFAGDQNPLPRGELLQAEQYGRELAVAVEQVMKAKGTMLEPKFSAQYEEIDLAINPPPSDAALDEAIENAADWHRRWAMAMKEKKSKGEKMEKSYPFYPIQSWQLGVQSLVILGGEVVVDYAFRLREMLGNDLMIMGYANDVMAYIPSERILKEGGYEGETSMYVYGHDGTWATGIEDKIVEVVEKQVRELRSTAKHKD